MSETLKFALGLPAHPVSVSVARGVLKSLQRLRNDLDLEDAEIVLSELVTNAIRHGSPSLHDIVDIEITVNGDRLSGVVRDSGPVFDPRTYRRAPDQPGGFGLHIARSIAEVTVERSEMGNVVAFVMPVIADRH